MDENDAIEAAVTAAVPQISGMLEHLADEHGVDDRVFFIAVVAHMVGFVKASSKSDYAAMIDFAEKLADTYDRIIQND